LAEISARFPKLTAKFWEWWTRDKIYLDIRDILREILAPLEFSEEEINYPAASGRGIGSAKIA